MTFQRQFQPLHTDAGAASAGRRMVIDDPFLHRMQLRHFIIFDILPFVFTIVAVSMLAVLPVGMPELIAFLVMWVITGLGITCGYHRLFAHKSYAVSRPIRIALAIAGAMAGQGGVLSWVAMHRRHHERGDQEGDMHSPNLHGAGWRGKLRGLAHAHLTWMMAHPYPSVVHYAPDLLRDPDMVWVHRHYNLWAVLGFAMPAAFCALMTQSWTGLVSGALWGGMVRMFVLEQGIWSLNSLCHMVGSRKYVTRDKSRNIGLLAPFIFGESWHHNHHAFPASASFGLRWYRLDPGFWFIRLLGLLGLARDIKVPDAAQLKAREQ